MNFVRMKLFVGLLAVLFAIPSLDVAAGPQDRRTGVDRTQLEKQVRKQLVTLPWHGVFDNLAYQVNGDTVTLYGQVVRPSTRSDAERRVAKLNGVRRVVNNIKVLPLSGVDDSIRRQTYRELARTGGLYRYFMGANPSIHIVVDHGHVTLEGVVANTGDANMAYIAARSVPGAFSVTNNLRTDRGGRAY